MTKGLLYVLGIKCNFNINKVALHRWRAFVCLLVSVLMVHPLFAQRSIEIGDSIKIDTLTKVGTAFVFFGGLFLGYFQMKTAAKLAEFENKMTMMIVAVEEKFNLALQRQTEKFEDKLNLSTKDIEKRMATRHDLDNISALSKLQYEHIKLELENIKRLFSGNGK